MREMKDSGVEWVRKIPVTWNIEPLKVHFAFGKGLPITKENLVDEGLPVMSYGQIHSAKNSPLHIKDELIRFVGEEYRENIGSWANEGDILFADTSEDLNGIGNHACVDLEDGIFAGYHTILARKITSVDSRYFSLLFETDAWRNQLRCNSSGIKVFSVTKRMLGGVSVIVPSAQEQKSIADYLDIKCSIIDKSIEKQVSIIDKLREYRRSAISEAVMKGLKKDAELKDSDIDWLGSIPSHWNTYRIANLYEEVSENGDASLPILTVSINTGVSDRELSEEESDRVFIRSEDKSKYKRVRPGDLTYNMMRAWQGAFGAVRVDGMVSPAYVVARPKEKVEIDSRYIERLLRTPVAIEEMHRYSHGVADFRLRLYWPEFKNIRVCLPPISEQREIADYIDRINEQVDKRVELTEKIISKLTKYKKSLIYEVVTGKKEV